MSTASKAAIIARFTSDAPVDIEGLVAALGLRLNPATVVHPLIAGQIAPAADGVYEIAVNKVASPVRRRFTIAHELAHYLLHRDLIGTGVDDTRAYRSTPMGAFDNRAILDGHEAEASRLAIELLMPAALLRKAHADLGDDIPALAKAFAVSEKAMELRLHEMELRRV